MFRLHGYSESTLMFPCHYNVLKRVLCQIKRIFILSLFTRNIWRTIRKALNSPDIVVVVPHHFSRTFSTPFPSNSLFIEIDLQPFRETPSCPCPCTRDSPGPCAQDQKGAGGKRPRLSKMATGVGEWPFCIYLLLQMSHRSNTILSRWGMQIFMFPSTRRTLEPLSTPQSMIFVPITPPPIFLLGSKTMHLLALFGPPGATTHCL